MNRSGSGSPAVAVARDQSLVDIIGLQRARCDRARDRAHRRDDILPAAVWQREASVIPRLSCGHRDRLGKRVAHAGGSRSVSPSASTRISRFIRRLASVIR